MSRGLRCLPTYLLNCLVGMYLKKMILRLQTQILEDVLGTNCTTMQVLLMVAIVNTISSTTGWFTYAQIVQLIAQSSTK